MTEQSHVVVITGSSSGFGMLACIGFAQQGYDVIASMRDPSCGDRLLNAAAKAGVTHRITIIPLDVTDSPSVDKAVHYIEVHGGRVDVLINNAGYAMGGFTEDLSLDAWRKQLDVNVFGPIAVTRAMLPMLRRQSQGVIINVSSISGRIAFPGLGPYVASKHALEGFTETLRLELIGTSVKVVLVEPGSYIRQRNRGGDAL